MSAIQESRDLKVVAAGVGLLVAACAIAGVGAMGLVTLKVKNLVLPGWSMYVAAVVVAGIGAFCFLISDRKKCVACNEAMESEEAYFPLEAEQQVMRAVSELDTGLLVTLFPVPKGQMKSVIELTWCPKCEAVGMISASKWQDYQPHDLLPERQFSGPQVRAFARIAKAHAEFRGEDDE